MQLWLFSDWHWKHENIYKFVYTDTMGIERRVRERFVNSADGDAYIEQRWRDLVKPSDHIYNLGDCTMYRGKHMITEFIAMNRSLPGHKRLILGNHDHYDISVYVEAGFEKIRASNVIDGLLLTHYPVHPGSIGRAIGTVHGHTHQNPDVSPKHLNISVERTQYEPIPIETAKALLQAKISMAEQATPPSVLDVNRAVMEGP